MHSFKSIIIYKKILSFLFGYYSVCLQIKAYSFNIIDLVLMVRANKKCFNKKHSTCCCDEVTIDRIISIASVMCWCIWSLFESFFKRVGRNVSTIRTDWHNMLWEVDWGESHVFKPPFIGCSTCPQVWSIVGLEFVPLLAFCYLNFSQY